MFFIDLEKYIKKEKKILNIIVKKFSFIILLNLCMFFGCSFTICSEGNNKMCLSFL